MSSGGVKRAVRVSGRIKAELMDLFLRGTVRDPLARDVVISAVKVTDDLRSAWVYVRLMRPETQEAERLQIVDTLMKARGFLRRELGPRLQLRYSPELKFFWDEQPDQAERIEQLLDEVREPTDGQ